jgi:sialidase-1
MIFTMLYFSRSLIAALLLITVFSLACAQKITTDKQSVAVAHTYAIPVMKGKELNPVIRVAVSIPAGSKSQPLQSIQLSLNADALASIDSIEIYVTGATPFNNRQRIGLVNDLKAQTVVKTDVNLEPGVHFIWISPVLKINAPINKVLELKCTNLEMQSGTQLSVKQQGNNGQLRTGYAVRKIMDDNVHTYRIPGIVQTDKGSLISVYDIRYNNDRDLPGNIDVGMSRSTDGGSTWEPMKIIMDMGAPHENNGIGDPAILFDPATRTIWVAALWSKGNRSIAGSLPGLSPDTTGQFVLVKSTDDGRTWSAPINITKQVKNPAWHLFFNGPGSGIAMQNGTLVFAAQYWDEKKMPHSTLIYSSDKGNTWKGSINGPKSNTTEAQLVETTPGTLMLNMRDNRGAYRSVATTTNLGASWTEHTTSYNALPDPVCMASLIKAKVKVGGVFKEVLFFSNPNTTSGRYNITIKASLDMGETWLPAHQLLIDERLCYGYSSLTQIDENTIGILYEGSRELYFVRVPVASVIP